MRSPYINTIQTLRELDEKQLIQLFHDINRIKVIERIADAAFHFIENYQPVEPEKTELSQDEDAFEVDNLRRAREGI